MSLDDIRKAIANGTYEEEAFDVPWTHHGGELRIWNASEVAIKHAARFDRTARGDAAYEWLQARKPIDVGTWVNLAEDEGRMTLLVVERPSEYERIVMADEGTEGTFHITELSHVSRGCIPNTTRTGMPMTWLSRISAPQLWLSR